MLSRREKLSYGSGDFACAMYWQTFMVYLTFYYTDVYGLSALEAGTLLGVSRAFDAVFDPLVGVLADRTRSRWGKFRPWLLWLAVPLALAGVLTFTVPSGSHGVRLAWAWVTFNALMLLYSAVNIPYTALLAVMTPAPEERTTLSSIKFSFAFVGGTLTSASLLPLCRALGAGDVARGWQACSMIIGALTVACLAVTFTGVRERVAPPRGQDASLLRDLGGAVRNGPWLLLAAVTLAFTLFVAVRSSVVLHYLKYYVGERALTLPSALPVIGGTHTWRIETLVSAFHGSGQIAACLGVVLLPFVARAAGRKLTFTALLLLALASVVAFYFLRPDHILLMLGLNVIGNLVGGPLGALLWSMYADAVDYAEWKTGRRATGLLFSALLFIGKQGWGLGAALTLFLMSRVGFAANAEQNPESLAGLVLLVSLIPAGLGALTLIPLAFYPLDEGMVARMGRELAERRLEAEADASAGRAGNDARPAELSAST